MTLEEKKEALIHTEWKQFQQVENEGGRASCQDDPETFFLMRRSQFVAWPEALVDSWHEDLKEAEAEGRNLLAEKYAWMMRQTAPEEFRKFSKTLRFPSIFTEQLIETLVAVQVAWMEEYKAQYPYLAAGNRALHSSEDTPYTTSFETYLRGELHTYSDKTLRLYQDMVNQLKKEGKNISLLIMEATVRAYGYESMEEAEERQKKRFER